MRTPFRGYTLIELIVSVAIFSFVMLFTTSAYLSLISATRHARATSSIMTNIDAAIDSMSREIRTGSGYSCGVGGDCFTTPGNKFSFTDEDGDTITYLLVNGAIAQCISTIAVPITCNAITASAITDPAITVTALTFYVRGTASFVSGDKIQPNVVIVVKGTSTVAQSSPITFSIETSATERLIDAGS